MGLIIGRHVGDKFVMRIPSDITEDELQQLISEGITSRVHDIQQAQPRLDINAPRVLNIVRSELLPETDPAHQPHRTQRED